MRRTLLVLVELVLFVVILAACSILITVTALPAWTILALIFVAFAAWLLFVAILVTVPRDAKTYNNRGLARDRKGDLAGAIADYDRAIELDPKCGTAYLNRGIARARKGDLAGAITDYDHAIEIDPADIAAYVSRGTARAEEKNWADAIADYSRAIELRPDFAGAYFGRAAVHTEQGYRAAAIADYDRAIEIDPRLGPAYADRGLARAEEGDRAAAIADYDEAIRLLPTDPEKAWVYACRARAYIAMGDAPAACESLAAAIALDPHWRDTARTDPVFDPIRGDPCFQALVAGSDAPR